MKRHLAPALFSLSLCAVMGGARTAGAQSLDGIALPPADTASVTTAVPEAAAPLALVASAPLDIVRREDSPLIPDRAAGLVVRVGPGVGAAPVAAGAPRIAATGIRPVDVLAPTSDAPLAAPPALVDWKMPTSRALMIGGASAALIGLAVVGGDTGAIIALSGTAVAVYGLYLHYNR